MEGISVDALVEVVVKSKLIVVTRAGSVPKFFGFGFKFQTRFGFGFNRFQKMLNIRFYGSYGF